MKRMMLVVVLAAITAVTGGWAVVINFDTIRNAPAPPPRPSPRIVFAKVTAYDAGCRICTGKWWRRGRTATGRNGRTTQGLAADPSLFPYGTKIYVPGRGVLTVDDTGGAMRKSWREEKIVHLDLRLPTHEEAKQFGVQWIPVHVLP